MLGRLKMDVQQCIEAYRSLSSEAFTRIHHSPVNAKAKVQAAFSSANLEAAVKHILVNQGYREDALLKDTDEGCRV